MKEVMNKSKRQGSENGNLCNYTTCGTPLVVKTLSSQCRSPRFDPWSGTQIPHVASECWMIIHMKQPRSCIPQPTSYEAKIIINNNNMWLHILSQSKYTEIPRYRNFTGSVSWWYCNKTRNNHNVKKKINYLESLKHSPNSSRDKDRIKSVITKDF